MYAIVLARGCYGSGTRVSAERLMSSLEDAQELAEKWTRDAREELRRYCGANSFGYRVVALDGCEPEWLGWELDQWPTADISDDSYDREAV